MRHGSLFSGIGGFDLAASWRGWQNVFHVEQDAFCQRVLTHHFPESDAHHDIKTFDAAQYANGIDILTGGFPCQGFSTNGKRKGMRDARWLWPEMFAVVRAIQPTWVIAENVRGFTNYSQGHALDTVCHDLEDEGYTVRPFILPAACTRAPHARQRIFIVATNTHGHGLERGISANVNRQQPVQAAHAQERIHSHRAAIPFQAFPTVPAVCGSDDGVPAGMDGITIREWRKQTLKAYGNAVVPQLAAMLFDCIESIKDV